MRFPLFGIGLRRRRPFSIKAFLVILTIVLGVNQVDRWYVTQQEYQGRIVKTYEKPSWWRSTRSNKASDQLWDIRTTDGSIQTVKVRSRRIWAQGLAGDQVTKVSGELDPQLHSSR